MSNKRALQTNDLGFLDSIIKMQHPKLTKTQVRKVRSRLIQYIASGLSNGFDIALIKVLNEEKEISIKVLKLRDEDDE